MKSFIQEYGLILVGVAAMLLCLLFGKQVFNQDITNTTVDNIVELRKDKEDMGYVNDGPKVKYDKISKTYTIGTSVSFMDSCWWGDGLSFGDTTVEIPYEKWCVIEFEINPSVDAKYVADINNKAIGINNWSGNDNDNQATRHNTSGNLKKGEWKKVYIYYQNSNEYNTKKVPITPDRTFLGIKYDKSLGNQSFQIRNLKIYMSTNAPRNV